MLKKCKSIKQIYNEVKNFDLVITVDDAALSTALNKLVKKPMLGMFCYTPRAMASKFAPFIFDHELLDDKTVILEITKKLKMNIKNAHYHVRNINQIWGEVGELEKTKEYISDESKKVIDFMKLTNNYAVEKFDFKKVFKKEKIAVIDADSFNELEKKVLPENYTDINLFEGKYNIPLIHSFLSEKDVVDRVVSMINSDIENDVAIILNTRSNYLPLLKSRLLNKDIKTNVNEYLTDHFITRTFLGLIETSINIDSVLVREISPFLSILNIKIDPIFNNFLFSKYMQKQNKDEYLEKVYNILKNEKKYSQFISELKLELPFELIDIIHKLQLYDKKITGENFGFISYYIENFDIQMKSEKGVVFIDANNTAFVDRPVCFYLGIDISWTNTVQKREWLDKDKNDSINLDKFQVLLQQGDEKYYFITEVKNNASVIPCYYFNILFNRKIESFNDIFKTQKIENKPYPIKKEPVKQNIPVKQADFDCFSQSSLNSFATCPKIYAYDNSISNPQQTYFLKGTLLHSFAEFYLNYPDYVKSKGVDFFVNMLIDEYSQMTNEIEPEISNLKIGILNIIEFIDSLDISNDISVNEENKTRYNLFSDKLGKPLNKKNTEVFFKDPRSNIKGIIDLIVDNSIIVDYKTSKNARSTSDIVKCANLKLIKDQIDFQPVLYIAERRKHFSSKIKFIYNFILANRENVISGEAEQDQNLVYVEYIPTTFNEFLATKEAINMLATSQDRTALIEEVGINDLISFFQQNPIPEDLQFDKVLIIESEYINKFSGFIFSILKKETKTLQKTIEGILKKIVAIRTGANDSAFFFKEDIDAFEIFLKEKHNLINEYIKKSFPFDPITKDICNDCQHIDICVRLYEESKTR